VSSKGRPELITQRPAVCAAPVRKTMAVRVPQRRIAPRVPPMAMQHSNRAPQHHRLVVRKLAPMKPILGNRDAAAVDGSISRDPQVEVVVLETVHRFVEKADVIQDRAPLLGEAFRRVARRTSSRVSRPGVLGFVGREAVKLGATDKRAGPHHGD